VSTPLLGVSLVKDIIVGINTISPYRGFILQPRRRRVVDVVLDVVYHGDHGQVNRGVLHVSRADLVFADKCGDTNQRRNAKDRLLHRKLDDVMTRNPKPARLV